MIALKEQSAPTRSFQRPPTGKQLLGRAEHPLNPGARQPSDRDTQPERKIKHILVPTNFSAGSAEAVARAAKLARHHDAKLTVLHVVDINSPAAWTHSGTADGLMHGLWTEGLSKLQRLVESLTEKLPDVRSCIAEGLPAEEIIHHSGNFDLLVLGEDPRKGVWNLFSKNTARQVVAKAECRVMVVPRGDVEEPNSVMCIVPEASNARGSQLSSARPQS